MNKPAKTQRTIMLALQGGGAHGAYTWGVLNRLLDEDDLRIVAVSGTSAGAMNGAVLAYNLGAQHDRSKAKSRLRAFWEDISRIGDAAFNPYRIRNPLDGSWNTDSLLPYIALNMLGSASSPYDRPQRGDNPLVAPLNDCISDFSDKGAVPLYVCATNVKTMERRVFESRKGEISVAALTASAAIPNLYPAVEVEPGQFYWDGGFLGNPVLRNLVRHKDECTDILIVEINPWTRAELPKRSWEIADRQNEITFNSSLALEINAIESVNELIPHLSSAMQAQKKKVNFHHIPSALADLGINSKYNTSRPFIEELQERGYAAADSWLKESKKQVNVCSSCDVRRVFAQALG